MEKFIVVESKEVIITDTNGSDFKTRNGDTIEIEDEEVYWKPVNHYGRYSTNMRVSYIHHLLKKEVIQLVKGEKSVFSYDLSKTGGKWLGVARSWLQSNTNNGDRVTWGSRDILEPALTVKDVEELASVVAAAAINEYIDKLEREKKL